MIESETGLASLMVAHARFQEEEARQWRHLMGPLYEALVQRFVDVVKQNPEN